MLGDSRPPEPPSYAGGDRTHEFEHLTRTLCYPIVFPGRKSGFRAGFRPDSSRENIKVCLHTGRRAEFEAFPIRIRSKSVPGVRFPARKHYCVT